MRFSTLASAAALFELSIAGYVLEDDYMNDFFGAFNFFTGADLTEGFVDYVDEATARSSNLINGSSSSVVQWGVDTINKTPNGRPSVRIESKKKYDSGLIVLDVAHMPFGCGTWPAFWTVGPDWPHNGEIDILEGVNVQTNNGMTLHTGPGCQISQDSTAFSGTVNSDNCDVAAIDQPDNTGCSIEHPSTKSYGAGLNENGGGVYATQWTSEAISIYFFPRDSIPADVLGDNPDPSGWGKPAAKFSNAGCNIEKTFSQQQIVFDTTFCGVWAGSKSVWDASTCSQKAQTCDEWVRDNPEAFTEAYWTVNALKVYQDNGEAPVPKPSASPVQSTVISKPIPKPTITASFPANPPVSTYPANISTPTAPIGVPSVSDGIFAPIPTTSVLPDVPVPSSPATPGNNNTAPDAPPAGTPTTTRRPTVPNATQPAAPTGANGMPGFAWPVAVGGGGSNNNDNNNNEPANPSSPSPTTTIAPIASSPPANPPVEQVPAPTPAPAVPVIPDTPGIQTVYETIYRTVTVDPPVGTPTPGLAKRDKRHARHHRQRITRHNAVRM